MAGRSCSWSFYCLFLLTIFSLTNCERTSRKIYEYLSADYPCFRRLNGTHQIGCSSSRGGDVGVVHYVANVSDLEWLLDHGPYAPYVAIIEPLFFNRNNLTKMQASGKINGVLVISPVNSSAPERGFSPDQTCPNNRYGLYDESTRCSVGWNSFGDGMFFEDWRFPIFLIQDQEDIDRLVQKCYQTFNAPYDGKPRSWPLCSAELLSNMHAAKDTPTCIRRSNMITILNPAEVCDPMGDLNIWSSLFPMNKSTPLQNRSLIFVAARMDSFSMFENIGPGGDSAVSGLVTLLAVAEALFKLKDKIKSDKNVVFVIFNGEAFDYIGSSRMVYEMQNGVFPSHLDDNILSQPPLIALSHISHFIELNQIGLSFENGLWAHSDPLSTTAHEQVNVTVKALLAHLMSEGSKLNFTVNEALPSDPLPPASMQRFLKEDLEIPGIVITDHAKAYFNKYYNGMFDRLNIYGTSSAIPKNLNDVATVVTRTIYALLTEEEASAAAPTDNLMEQMLECYQNSGNCELFDIVNPSGKRSVNAPTNLYVGVERSFNYMTLMTTQLLAYLMGERLNITSSDCYSPLDNDIFTYKWMSGDDTEGFCVKSTVNNTRAVSPAFDITDYDFTTQQYSTWTESVWDSFSLRVFLKPSLQQEVVTLGIGIFVLLLSFGSVWFLDRSSDVLFACPGIMSGAC